MSAESPTAPPSAFELVCGYWPRARGPYWWQDFSLPPIREEFELTAEAGIQSLQLFLTWGDFQVGGGRVVASSMRNLEHTLDTGVEFGLNFRLTLFPISIAGRSWLPGWLLDPMSVGDQAFMVGSTESRRQALNLYQSPDACGAAARLVREVVGAFDAHPAVSGWVLGDRLSAATRPARAVDFERWLGSITNEAQVAGARKPLWHGISARELITSPAVDVALMAELGVAPVIATDWTPSWARAGSGAWASFLSRYSTSLAPSSGRLIARPLLAEIGGCPPTPSRVDEELRGALDGGAGGGILPAVFDYLPDLQRTPLFRDAPGRLRCGLLDTRGDPTRSGITFIESNSSHETIHDPETQFDAADPEERRRSPESTARECFEQMTR